MSTSKYFDAICLIVIVFAVGLTVAFMNGEQLGLRTARAANGYESRLFDASRVHEIELVMSDFDDLCTQADKDAWFDCAAVIDGEKFSNVSIRVRGRAAEIESRGSIKYSFKIEFDHTNKLESYHGLDELDLSSCDGDCTYMKDHVVYEMMAEAGVPAPLTSYAYLTVNGEDIGLYLAVESIEDAFLKRNFGQNAGNLYKPSCDETVYVRPEPPKNQANVTSGSSESIIGRTEENSGRDVTFADPAMHIDPDVLSESDRPAATSVSTEGEAASQTDGGGTQTDPSSAEAARGQSDGTTAGSSDGQTDPSMAEAARGQSDDITAGGNDGQTDPSIAEAANGQPDGTGGQTEESGGGEDVLSAIVCPDDIKLIYVDDDPESYPNIFGHSGQDVDERDRKRLIEALKKLNTEDIAAEVVNTEEVIAYFAVHNFVVSLNSYTGESADNYYLYEKDGRLSMLPWDYSSAFGSYRSQDAGRMVNYPIDTPLARGLSGERPMFEWIMKDQEYVAAYHAALEKTASAFCENSLSVSRLRRLEEMLTPYVVKDPNKFSSETAFHKGVSTLISFLELRSKSVKSQLSGEIPATYDGQNSAPDSLIDASEIELIDMK